MKDQENEITVNQVNEESGKIQKPKPIGRGVFTQFLQEEIARTGNPIVLKNPYIKKTYEDLKASGEL